MKRIILIINLLILNAACSSINNNDLGNLSMATAEPLDKFTLIQLLPGATLYKSNNNEVHVAFYSADKTMKGNTWGSAKERIDEGVWSIEENGELCNAWQGEWSSGAGMSCYNIYPALQKDLYIMILDQAENADLNLHESYLLTITPAAEDEFE